MPGVAEALLSGRSDCMRSALTVFTPTLSPALGLPYLFCFSNPMNRGQLRLVKGPVTITSPPLGWNPHPPHLFASLKVLMESPMGLVPIRPARRCIKASNINDKSTTRHLR